MGINASGQIAGYAQDSAYGYIGFVQSPGGDLTTFQYSSGQFISAEGTICDGVNSSGTALCRFAYSGTTIFTRTWAGVSTPVVLPTGDMSWNPAAVNDQGDIAGQFEDSNFQFHAYLRAHDGTFTPFDPPTGGVSGISGINDAGEIIGEFIDGQNRLHGFMRTVDGVFTQIDAPGPSGEATYLTDLYGINSSGAMVGSVRAASGYHGFLRTAGGTVTLIDPPGVGGPGSYASAINTSGVIAGYFYDSNSVSHGYVRNLDYSFTIIDHPDAYAGTFISGLNDSGQVVGTYVDAQGAFHGFVRK